MTTVTYYLRTFYFSFSLSSRNSDLLAVGSLSMLFSHPPHYGTRLQFYREKGTALFSLVD